MPVPCTTANQSWPSDCMNPFGQLLTVGPVQEGKDCVKITELRVTYMPQGWSDNILHLLLAKISFICHYRIYIKGKTFLTKA